MSCCPVGRVINNCLPKRWSSHNHSKSIPSSQAGGRAVHNNLVTGAASTSTKYCRMGEEVRPSWLSSLINQADKIVLWTVGYGDTPVGESEHSDEDAQVVHRKFLTRAQTKPSEHSQTTILIVVLVRFLVERYSNRNSECNYLCNSSPVLRSSRLVDQCHPNP